MFHRILFALRRAMLDGGRWLGSWRLSIATMTALAFYQALLAIWSASTPPHVVRSIAGLTVFYLVYALILLNTLVCFWRRISQLRSNPGSFLFHGSFLLIALGFLLSYTSRQEATLWVATGESFTGLEEQILSQTPPRILSLGLPDMEFTVDGITPEFWQDQLFFTRLEADLILQDGQRATTKINSPLFWDPITCLRLSGFGYAPRWEILDANSQMRDTAFAKLNIFPPGLQDFFTIPGLPHRFHVDLVPDLARDEAGQAFTQTLNLRNPAVNLNVWRGRVDLGGGLIQAGQGFEFDELFLQFPEIRYWGEFTVIRDPGMLLLFLGYAMALAGLLMKLAMRTM